MVDGKDCFCKGEGKVRIIYACAGASNVGQLSNDVAVELTRRGEGRMGCLVGLAANVSTMVQNAKAADSLLVIDGCGVACARKVLEGKGLIPDSMILTEMGVDKDYDLTAGKDRVHQLATKVTDGLDKSINIITPGKGCGL